MLLRTPQLIRPVLFWCEFKDKKPLILVHEMKKQVFRLGENAFFVIPHVMYWWSWHSLPDDPCNRPGFQQERSMTYQFKVPEHLQERSMTYQFKVPEHLQERSMTYQFNVPEQLQERSMTYQFKVPEHLQERSMTYQLKATENLPSKFTWTLPHAPPHPTPPISTRT